MHDAFAPKPIGLSEIEVASRFDALQRKLTPLWASMARFTQDAQTIVVVPSISLDSGARGVRQVRGRRRQAARCRRRAGADDEAVVDVA